MAESGRPAEEVLITDLLRTLVSPGQAGQGSETSDKGGACSSGPQEARCSSGHALRGMLDVRAARHPRPLHRRRRCGRSLALPPPPPPPTHLCSNVGAQGVKQYDQRFVDCLMDLTYRATSDILKDAAVGAAGHS